MDLREYIIFNTVGLLIIAGLFGLAFLDHSSSHLVYLPYPGN